MRVAANGLEFEVVSEGDPAAPCILLIMGLGMQLVAWPPELVGALLAAGFRVVRFDNRDAGLSTHLVDAPVPSLVGTSVRRWLGLSIAAPYALSDMARDSVGILDALGVERAHVVGVSMGGMIAQIVAARAPQRVLSLVSIMSTSGARGLPGGRPEALRALLSRPPGRSDLDGLVEHYVRVFEVIGSPGFPTPRDVARARLRTSLARAVYPAGTARQMVAVAAAPDRSAELATVRAPALVIHGADDPLIPVACGRDTAAKIPGARLLVVPGMGHDLAPALVPVLSRALLDHFTPSAR